MNGTIWCEIMPLSSGCDTERKTKMLFVLVNGNNRTCCSLYLTGLSYNPITFGNLQKINKPNTVCEDPDETQPIESCNRHVSLENCVKRYIPGIEIPVSVREIASVY